jgi:hypothetical protein
MTSVRGKHIRIDRVSLGSHSGDMYCDIERALITVERAAIDLRVVPVEMHALRSRCWRKPK